MSIITNIESAHQNNYLWPTIADAVDTYYRRRNCDADNVETDNYERIWRLIQIWEAIIITLSGIGVARIKSLENEKPLFLKCREHLYGRYYKTLEKSFEKRQGALPDGSIGRRLDVLSVFSNSYSIDSKFTKSLQFFLNSQSIDLSKLVVAWSRVCYVPDDLKSSNKHSVLSAMRYINEFRNRFAHVPFTYDSLFEIAESLEDVTEQLFAIEPLPHKTFINDDKTDSPLTGAFYSKGKLLKGSMPVRTPDQYKEKLSDFDNVCVFPNSPKKNGDIEIWDNIPFIFIDNNKRSFVLTRLKSEENGLWEYTRYRAEANSVILKEEPKWLNLVPNVKVEEYITIEIKQEDEEEVKLVKEISNLSDLDPRINSNQVSEFEEALRYIRNEEYEPAIGYFTKIVNTNPQYHIGWLRLGIAQRQLAVRKRISNIEQAKQLFSDSCSSLTKATNHIITSRSAQAYYERSKTYYHWGRCDNDDISLLVKAVEDAEQACKLYDDREYETWIDYLKKI